MKRLLVFVAATCACALALHADFTYSNNVFRAIGTGATGTNDLKAVNGTWSSFESSVGKITWADASLVYDLEKDQSIKFTVSDGVAPDTNTVVKIEMKGVLAPVYTNDFTSTSDMNARNAQVGFAIGINADATPVTTNYYAWAGDDWTLLAYDNAAAAPDVVGETDLIATFNYMTNDDHFVSFDIVKNSTTNRLTDAVSGVAALPLTSSAGTYSNNLAGVSCSGSGKLRSADGSVGLAVATLSDGVRDVKYGSIEDAVVAAGTSAATVTVVRATSDGATIPEGSKITISDPGKQAKGEISVASGAHVTVEPAPGDLVNGGMSATNLTIALDVSAGNADQVSIDLGSVGDHKEVTNKRLAGKEITFDLQTKSSILKAVQPDGANVVNLIPDNVDNVNALRAFLKSDEGLNAADVSASVDSTSLSNALAQVGANGIAKWQSFVLGVSTEDSIKPVGAPAGDTEPAKIKLAIPLIGTRGDWAGKSNYNVTYAVEGNTVNPSSAGNIELDSLPTTEGATRGKTYTIKAVIRPKSE